MTAEFLSVIAIAVITMLLSVTLKDIKSEYAVLVSMVGAAVLLGWGVSRLDPIAQKITELAELSQMQTEHSEILFKAVAISLFTRLGRDICCDSGETAIGSKVEFCGRICLMLLAMPLFEDLIGLAEEILSA